MKSSYGQALWGRQGQHVSMAMCSQALPLRMKRLCSNKDGLLGMSLKNSVFCWPCSRQNAQHATEGISLWQLTEEDSRNTILHTRRHFKRGLSSCTLASSSCSLLRGISERCQTRGNSLSVDSAMRPQSIPWKRRFPNMAPLPKSM
ncbi:hypothetical protein KOW79_009167 [Hemibagrus wyckioides]|uniref:Uncharacterized protein n=1 Tax=Hemibagrus wyckioides TaxID=337641 RepID=A0A9D3SK70_9TELE|nr:hypothetical protein KOW79_009167 [Hemibagrus wyckioides]